jgi:hypothetical protein
MATIRNDIPFWVCLFVALYLAILAGGAMVVFCTRAFFG